MRTRRASCLVFVPGFAQHKTTAGLCKRPSARSLLRLNLLSRKLLKLSAPYSIDHVNASFFSASRDPIETRHFNLKLKKNGELLTHRTFVPIKAGFYPLAVEDTNASKKRYWNEV